MQKKTIKVRDLKPNKDAKGGAVTQGTTIQGATPQGGLPQGTTTQHGHHHPVQGHHHSQR